MEHIDELFRSKLGNAEVTAPQGVLESVQSQLATNITQQAGIQSASSFWSGALGMKIAGVVVAVGLSIGAVVWMNQDEPKPVKSSPEKQTKKSGALILNTDLSNIETSPIGVDSQDIQVYGSFGEPVFNEGNETSGDQNLGNLPERQIAEVVPFQGNIESRNNVKKADIEPQEIEDQIFGLPDDVAIKNDIKPNVFTPNGDGMNDSFFVELNSAEFLELVVLNRAGMKVFGTTDKNRKWAGDHLGMPCAAGVYRVVLKTKNKNTQEIVGDQWVLNLIR